MNSIDAELSHRARELRAVHVRSSVLARVLVTIGIVLAVVGVFTTLVAWEREGLPRAAWPTVGWCLGLGFGATAIGLVARARGQRARDELVLEARTLSVNRNLVVARECGACRALQRLHEVTCTSCGAAL